MLPPDFVLDATIAQLQALLHADADLPAIVASLSRRTAAKTLSGDWAGPALTLMHGRVHPALIRQVQLLQGWRARASPEAGVWRLPDGESYYQQAIQLQTSTSASAEEIHRMGNDQVAAVSAEMDALLCQHGLRSGTVAQRMAALAEDARFTYPNSEAGRAQLLADLEAKVQAVQARLPGGNASQGALVCRLWRRLGLVCRTVGRRNGGVRRRSAGSPGRSAIDVVPRRPPGD